MGGMILGVVGGGGLSFLTMFALGVMHRYAFGPPMAPWGDPVFFTEMSALGLVVLIGVRVAAAWLGASAAVRLSDAPHATWAGPGAVMLSALVTAFAMGMAQPIWSLAVSVLLTAAVGWAVGRLHVGLPVIPGLRSPGA